MVWSINQTTYSEICLISRLLFWSCSYATSLITKLTQLWKIYCSCGCFAKIQNLSGLRLRYSGTYPCKYSSTIPNSANYYFSPHVIIQFLSITSNSRPHLFSTAFSKLWFSFVFFCLWCSVHGSIRTKPSARAEWSAGTSWEMARSPFFGDLLLVWY